jgi:hypothetical protein
MALLYPLLLVAAAVLLWRKRGGPGGRGWFWFGAWSAAGAVFAFSFLAGFSIGLLVLPFAAAGLFLVVSRSPHVPESLGFVAGVGGTLVLIAFLNYGQYRPCPENGALYIPADASPGASVECGGMDPMPWFVFGFVAAVPALIVYVITSRRRGAR